MAAHGLTRREIARACEKLAPDTLIDGEVIAIDDTGRSPSRHFSTADRAAHSADRLHRVDAGRAPASFELCRAAR
jgi:hypothetical protein